MSTTENRRIDWRQKLCSRKLWVAVTGLVTGILSMRGESADTIEQISGVILAAASVIAYIIGEGLADASHVEAKEEQGG